MPIALQCPCGKRYQVNEAYAGRPVACPACKRRLIVPQTATPESTKSEYTGVASPSLARPKALSPRPQTIGARSPVTSAPVQGSRLAPVKSDGMSSASNPGRLYIEIGQTLRCHWVYVGAVAGLISLIFFAAFSTEKVAPWLRWLAPLGVPGMFVYWLTLMKDKMARGNICAAVVTGQTPYRVAVYTDLSTMSGVSHPAVLVMDAKELVHAPGGPPKVGDRLAAVSLYSGPAKDGAWRGFSPTLVVAVTRNAADIARVNASISEDDWAEVEQAVVELGDVKPGLYRLDR